MRRLTLMLLALVCFVSCSDKSTDNSGTSDNVKLAGNYYGKFFAHYPPGYDYWVNDIDFNFADSTYSWTNRRPGHNSNESGAGHFKVSDDSIWFTDEVPRLADRIYLTLGGSYRLLFDGDAVNFHKQPAESLYEVVILERATIDK